MPLSFILEKAGVKKGANQVLAEGADEGPEPGTTRTMNFTRRLSIEKAMEDGTIIALEMNGMVLETQHGAPARLIVPGWYAMASVKWVKALGARSGEPFSVFFNDTKYVYVKEKDGQEVKEPVTELRVKALITEPLDGESGPGGASADLQGEGVVGCEQHRRRADRSWGRVGGRGGRPADRRQVRLDRVEEEVGPSEKGERHDRGEGGRPDGERAAPRAYAEQVSVWIQRRSQDPDRSRRERQDRNPRESIVPDWAEMDSSLRTIYSADRR